jgi:hypothetical protein
VSRRPFVRSSRQLVDNYPDTPPVPTTRLITRSAATTIEGWPS